MLRQIERRKAVLGIALGSRRIAMAVVSSHASNIALPYHQAMSLRRLKTPEARLNAFKGLTEKALQRFPVDAVSCVYREPTAKAVDAQHQALDQVCRDAGLALGARTNMDVRQLLVEGSGGQTNRALGSALQLRIPQLRAVLPDAVGTKQPSRFPSTQERYWFRIFMAIGTALCDLDESPGPLQAPWNEG